MPIRVTEAEKSLIRERAEACGLSVSDFVRQVAMGVARPSRAEGRAQRTRQRERAARQDRAAVEQGNLKRAERQAPGDREAIEQRIRREQPGLPASSVRTLASRELARG